jgi:hypothetical protein
MADPEDVADDKLDGRLGAADVRLADPGALR